MALELKDLCKSFKGLIATDHISLQIDRGEYIALLGPNGAGKTTLVEMIEGIQKPDSGEIRIFGATYEQEESRIRQKIGFSLQETRFMDKLTVRETLALFLSFYQVPMKQGRELLALTGLAEKEQTYVVHLSGGQRQKLALCIALAHAPEILILDEPTTGLDPAARREIWQIIRNLKQQGTTLILTTHYLEEAEYLCERILIMHRGSFLAQGTLQQLLKEHNMHEVIEFSCSEKLSRQAIQSLPGILHAESKETTEMLFVEEITRTLPGLLQLVRSQGTTLHSLECRKQNLDDLFLSMTGKTLDD